MKKRFTSIFGVSTMVAGTTTNISPAEQPSLPTTNTVVNPFDTSTLFYPRASDIIAAMARGPALAKKSEPAVAVIPDPVKPSPKEVEVNSADAEFAALNADIAREAAEKLGYQPLAIELTRIQRERDLVEALNAAGIVPLDPAQVEQYKTAMAQKKYNEEVKLRTRSYVYDMIIVRWDTTLLSAYTAPIPQHVLQTALTLRDELSTRGDVTTTFHVESLTVQHVTHDPFLYVTAGAGSPRHYIAVWDEPEFERATKS